MLDQKYTKLDDDVIFCEDVFTEEELAKINELCEAVISEKGFVDFATGDNITRKVETSGFPRNADSVFIYKKMANVLKEVNEQHFNFDVDGFVEGGLFFVSYNQPADSLGWHTDKINYDGKRKDFVKLGAILQLSDPSEYEGCDIEIMTDGILNIKKQKGLIYFIPGYVSHQVTKLISGKRNVVVAWLTGPRYK